MTVGTFTSCDEDTVIAWRSPVGFDAFAHQPRTPLTPFYRSDSVLFILDRRTQPWFMVTSPGHRLSVDASLAPAPYVGALSTVLSDLLTEEEP